MKRWSLLLVILGMGVVAAPSPAANVQRPVGAVKNCTEGQCHAAQRNYKVLHGPTALGACDVCHQSVDDKKHTYRLKQQDKALCDFCHVEKSVGKVMHKPVEDGQCLACHHPHGSSNKAMLRQEQMGALCASCHGDVAKNRKHVHGPVGSGSCAACHQSHRSDHKKLLVAEGKELCLGCHDQMKTQLASAKTLHKPMEGQCTQCHEVHASNQIMQLRQAPAALCVSCHQEVQKLAAAAPQKHAPMSEDNGCIQCHTPHGGDMAKLQKSDPVKACLSCHDKPLTTPDRRTVAAVPEVARKDLYLHGPIRDGNCSGCHTLHGGQVSRLLTKPYPQTFYESFNVEKYALCFTCHDKQLVELPKTTGLTRFRNGQVNLHYLHVNKSDRGRSCRACHSTHASRFPVHVRESVPYGKWELPINYKQTATGGTCAPGCHQELAYDRQTPAPGLAASTRPATTQENKP